MRLPNPFRRWRRQHRRTLVKRIRAQVLGPRELRVDPARWSAAAEERFSLATEYFRTGRLAKAERSYRKLLAQTPEHGGALHNLGLLCLEHGQGAEAIDLLRRAVAVYPDRPEFLTGLSLALENRGESSAAQDVLRTALALQRDYNPAYKHLVRIIAEEVKAGAKAKQQPQAEPPRARHGVGGRRRISVIICSIDKRKEQQVTGNYARLLAHSPHEIVVINDARSLCEGYNRGIERSSGDILIFSHDDVEIVSEDFTDKLLAYLDRYDMLAVAGTDRLIDPFWGKAGWPHVYGQVIHQRPADPSYEAWVFGFDPLTNAAIQAVDGLFFAVNRNVVEAVRFDQDRFTGFHFYDVDFSFSAYLAGFKIAVSTDILLVHASTGKLDDNWQRYAEIFARKFRGRFALPPPGSGARDVVSVGFGKRAEALEFCDKVVDAGRLIEARRLVLNKPPASVPPLRSHR